MMVYMYIQAGIVTCLRSTRYRTYSAHHEPNFDSQGRKTEARDLQDPERFYRDVR